jgi:hypothetical protein
VAIDFCLLVWATLGETLDLGLLNRMMAAYGVILPLWASFFGVDVGCIYEL